MDVKIFSIKKIGLSNRSTNALLRAGIQTVGDMLNCSEESLPKFRNIGPKSINEILEKIEEYKRIDEEGSFQYETDGEESSFRIPDDFEGWMKEPSNQKLIIEYLKDKAIRLETLVLLPVRAFNLLLFSEYDYVYQIAFWPVTKLMNIPRMTEDIAFEIEKTITCYIREVKNDIFVYAEQKFQKNALPQKVSLYEILRNKRYHDAIQQYVKANDIEIENWGLSNRPKNGLLSIECTHLSDIIFMECSDLMNIPAMGKNSADEIVRKIGEYLTENENRILAVISGDESALWDDISIRKIILDQYKEIGFEGLNLNEMIDRLQLPEQITIERLKSNIGQLIADNELEYVDYRCYRVYGKFEEYLHNCPDIDERSLDFINRRLRGDTLEVIGKDHNLSRERIRQIVKKYTEKVRNYYVCKTGMHMFDEDYFRYLYETYEFDKKDATEWLGVPRYVWNYLDLWDVKHGKEDLKKALEDYGLDVGLRLKIKNYLNRNKLYVDGMWIEKRRADLEQIVARKFCSDTVPYSAFGEIYNKFLEQEGIPYDEKLYYTEELYRSGYNRLSESRFLLWKLNEQLRYYDVDGRDYSELLDTLNMEAYENIELSTLKFMRDYPDIMEKFDIRDQYELHNLLRKIVPEGSYHDFHCERMPIVRFGEFDRDGAIFSILIDNAPISSDALAELINEEYGYDIGVTKANYFQSISEYYHQGIYSIDQKHMSDDHMEKLKKVLGDDFYFVDEIRRIYVGLIPNADVEEINPYNLKRMGFNVYSRYVLQNYNSLETYFYELLTKEDIIDISAYRKRYVYINVFSQKLMELKRNLEIVEFDPNQIINFRKLEQSGITRDAIRDFCNAVYDFIEPNEYFSAQSLNEAGFETELYEIGFSDWFYANLLISDERFSFAMMFGNLIFYKGKEDISIKSFETKLIQKYGCIDTYDLMNELTEKYGCNIHDKRDIYSKVQDTVIYYDKILDRLYANKDLYYRELEEGGF